MDKMLLLKGKLEMAKRTIQLSKASAAPKKTDVSEAKPITNTLVYKDVGEGDSSDNE